MTKIKNFEHGDFTFKAYWKPVGQGWEVGVTYKGESIFVGNFVHKAEATKWWATLTKEMTTFPQHYELSGEAPFRWYSKFLSNHLYKVYYNYLDKVFVAHTRHYHGAFAKDVQKYKRFYKPTAA